MSRTMGEILSEHDKQIISVINEQVNLLIDKSATDSTIINTLIEFIPEVKCLLGDDNDKALELYFGEYTGFTYFARLINQLENIS